MSTKPKNKNSEKVGWMGSREFLGHVKEAVWCGMMDRRSVYKALVQLEAMMEQEEEERREW